MESKAPVPAGGNAEAQAAAAAVARAITVRQILQGLTGQSGPGSAAGLPPGLVGPSVGGGPFGQPSNDYHFAEVEINDYPQHARWKVTHKGALAELLENVEVAVTTKGSYVPTGRKPMPGEQKLYLLIEGKDSMAVGRAKAEIQRVLDEAAEESRPEKPKYGKYTVVK